MKEEMTKVNEVTSKKAASEQSVLNIDVLEAGKMSR